MNERWCSLAGNVNWKQTLFCEAWFPTIWMPIMVLVQGLVEPSLVSPQVSRDLSVVGEHPIVSSTRIGPHVLVLPIDVGVHVLLPGTSHHCGTS